MICPSEMTEVRLPCRIGMYPWLVQKSVSLAITCPQRRACYKNVNVQPVPAGMGEGKVHAPAALRGRHMQAWVRLRQCCQSGCGHRSPPKSSPGDSTVLLQSAQRLVSIAQQ